jgi:chemotaxis protein histidine kinase CheA
LDIIDQMRISIPEEVKKAQQVSAQKDRVMAQAQEEANRTLQLAREKADQLADKDQIAQEASRRANQIIDQARMDAENIKSGADQYALDALASLADQLERLMGQVRNGMRVLEEKHPASPPPAEFQKE